MSRLEKEALAVRKMHEIFHLLADDEIEIAIDTETEFYQALDWAIKKRGEVKAMKEGLEAYIDELKGRVLTLTVRQQAFSDAIAAALDLAGLTKVQRPAATVYFATSRKGVEIVDMDQIPEEYIRVADPEPKKTDIYKALTNGADVPGAKLVDGTRSLNVRVK